MDDDYEIITENAEATEKFGEKLARSVRAGEILCLYGDLGSGKTTFTRGFAKGLGISTRLLSPTFIIVRRYTIPSTEKFLYHIDLYRLKNIGDLEELGLKEIFSDPNAYVVIEWADKLGDVMPDNRTDIHFTAEIYGKHKLITHKSH